MQLELRKLQQTLIIKQDELTQLNRDNARLLAEAQQLQKEQQNTRRINGLDCIFQLLGVGQK